jgi:ubiquinone/menaquinone biosynthesis C-methylase UbiE
MKDPYRLTARWYDPIFEPINEGLRLLGLRMFRPKKGMSILDVGCGTGVLLEFYRRYNCHLYGIDTSPAMLAIAEKRLGAGAELHRGSAAEMPYPDHSFDLVTSMMVLHEIKRPIQLAILDEIKRVLKPAGRLLLVDYNPGPVEFFDGWRSKGIILISEIAGGREHFKNYRRFMSTGGLQSLMDSAELTVIKQKVVAGGPIKLMLVKTGEIKN